MKKFSRILVVDDDANLRKTLSDILRLKGYEVVAAESGAEGIAEAKRVFISVALIDLKLPDMSGIEVMEQIKTASPYTEAIILTGNASLDTAVGAINKGAYSYLLKPYEIEYLLLKIHHASDRQQAQEEIRRLASFPTLNPQPVIEIAPSGKVSYVNPAADSLFPDLRLLDGQHPLLIGLGDIYAIFRQGTQTEMVREITIGESSYEKHIYYVPENELVRITVEDVTKRKRLELDKEQYFKFFLLSINPMCIADPYGCFKQVNPAFVKLTGYSESELIAKPFLDFVLPEDRQRTEDEMKLQVRSRPTLHFDNRYLCKDGTVIDLSWSAYYDSHDGITYATAIDITQFKQAQEELRVSREKLHRLLDTMAESAYGVDTNGDCTFVNRAFLQILGYQNENELMGKHIHELIHHSHPDGSPYPESECSVYRASRTNQPSHVSDEVFWRKDGVAVPIEFWAQPIVSDGVVTGAIITFTDITERKEVEAKLAEQMQELRRWNDITSGREERILDLKHEVNELLGRTGKPLRYPSAEAQDQTKE